ncbi:MAG: radical SAM protein [Terriglobia bacterium]|jgi:putative pyruvate formate lyase activating enzyme
MQGKARVENRTFEPAYLHLHRSGELLRRVERALELLRSCRACPRHCRVNRLDDKFAVCRTGRYATVSSYSPHHGEEDCLRGWRGSGTIFLSGCNLRCVFCQNFEISWRVQGSPAPPRRLAAMMLELQACGCHNINFVTPEHVVPQIIEALPLAIEGGLRLPIVYNTSGYDSMESLELLEGVVDIYMPDFKYWDSEMARKYSRAPDYPQVAHRVLKEMHRQVGDLVIDEDGVAKRGLLIRHLVMPGDIAGTGEIMRWIAQELSPTTYVNLMAQYYPAGKVTRSEFPEINRRVTRVEYERALDEAWRAGLERLDSRRHSLPGIL